MTFLKMRCLIYCILFCSLVRSGTCGNETLTESDLLGTVFDVYKSDVRPRINMSEPVEIKLDMFIMSIDKVDEQRQTFTLRAFMEVGWRDDFLTWEPEKYGGVRNINIPNMKLWLPDLALLDVYDSLTDIGQKDGRAVVDYNGSVVIWPYKMYTVGCKIKISRFPFDEQTCVLDFVSWTNPISALDLRTSDELTLGRYSESAEWSLENYTSEYYLMQFGDDAWAHVKYVFKLRRKWLFHVLNIITPIVVISLLNVTCFLVPAACGEKITLCISIFLTLAVFLTIITSSMPESSDEVSILGVYVGLQLLGSALTILATVISLCFYNKDKSTRVPLLLRFMCKICCQTSKPEQCMQKQNGQNALIEEGKVPEGTCNPTSGCCQPEVTWEIASSAFDRLCMWVALFWHTSLLVGFLVGLKS